MGSRSKGEKIFVEERICSSKVSIFHTGDSSSPAVHIPNSSAIVMDKRKWFTMKISAGHPCEVAPKGVQITFSAVCSQENVKYCAGCQGIEVLQRGRAGDQLERGGIILSPPGPPP